MSTDKETFKTFGIALESFKVKRFRAELARNGYQTKLGPGVTKDSATLMIKGVTLDDVEPVRRILERLQREFASRN